MSTLEWTSMDSMSKKSADRKKLRTAVLGSLERADCAGQISSEIMKDPEIILGLVSPAKPTATKFYVLTRLCQESFALSWAADRSMSSGRVIGARLQQVFHREVTPLTPLRARDRSQSRVTDINAERPSGKAPRRARRFTGLMRVRTSTRPPAFTGSAM